MEDFARRIRIRAPKYPNPTTIPTKKHINHTKKHFSWYLKGFNGASEWRRKFMYCNNICEIEKSLYDYEKYIY